MLPPDAGHDRRVAHEIETGRVTPFLGAGVNLSGRLPGTDWKPGQSLPSADELARHLANVFGYPDGEVRSLVRVAQFIQVMLGMAPLYGELRSVLVADYRPTSVHRFLARVPAILRQRDLSVPNQLIVTTNYDDALERAFAEAGQPFDLVKYIARGRNRGLFQHIDPDGRSTVITVPNEYFELALDERPAILKVHGAVDRQAPAGDSYVVTEDQYIEYVARTEISNLIPIQLRERLSFTGILFLGYSLQDWNLRVILHKIWEEQDEDLSYHSWSIQLHAHPFDEKLWSSRNVELQIVPLETYITELERWLVTGVPDGAH
jgi:hypothetical protein